MANLNALWAHTRCQVVSSTWRLGPYRGPDGCRAHLRRLGFRGRFHRDWRTRDQVESDGRGYEDRPRGKQIRDWLVVHPGVPTYAIVDDDSDMLHEQMPRYVKTGYELGLGARMSSAWRPC